LIIIGMHTVRRVIFRLQLRKKSSKKRKEIRQTC
jgi:hypothetical protein